MNQKILAEKLKGASSRLLFDHGVVQGLVIGPLLFLVMINDLDRHKNTTLFANNTTLVSRGPPVDQAQEHATQYNGFSFVA